LIKAEKFSIYFSAKILKNNCTLSLPPYGHVCRPLKSWSGSLSDRALEEMANENLSVMRFLNLHLKDMVPDHSMLSLSQDN